MMNNMSLQGCREGYGDSHGPAALTIGFKLFLTDPGWAVTVWWCENSKKVPAVDHLCTVYPEHYWQVQIQTYFATSVWSLQKRVETERVHISTYGKSKTDFLQHGQLSVQNLLPNPRRIAEPVSRQHSHREFPSSISEQFFAVKISLTVFELSADLCKTKSIGGPVATEMPSKGCVRFPTNSGYVPPAMWRKDWTHIRTPCYRAEGR